MQHLLYKILCCSIVILLVSCEKKEDVVEYGSLYGFVSDKNTGSSLQNASVELRPVGLKTVTGSDGQYEFPKVEEGKYKLYVSKTGYSDTIAEIDVKGNADPKKVDIQLEPLPPALTIVDGNQQKVDTIDFGYEEDDLARVFNIFNNGEETIKWQITKTVNWIISIKPEEGELKSGATQSVVMVIDRSLLAEGNNPTTVHITSNNGSKQLYVTAIGYSIPVVHMYPIEDISYKSAVLVGGIVNKGLPEYSMFGFVYSTSPNPTWQTSIQKISYLYKDIEPLGEKDKIKHEIKHLNIGTTYYARAYAINAKDTAYSDEVDFSTTLAAVPRLSIVAISDTTPTTAISGGIIEDDGGSAIIARGVCWAETPYPTTENAYTFNGQGNEAFTSIMTGLKPNTNYYVRAYAENATGTGYSKQLDFVTLSGLPKISIKTTDAKAKSITVNSEISTDGGYPVTKRGICYSNSNAEPSLNDTYIPNGSGNGVFITLINNASPSTTYYIRAYATNSVGTSYSQTVPITTQNGEAIVTGTVDNTTITAISASGTVTVTNNGGAVLQESGLCWSTTHDPTITSNHVIGGNQLNMVYDCNITDLAPNTTYYVRAYAVTDVAITYGDEEQFTTKSGLPKVTTDEITTSNVTPNSFACGGNVTEEGDAPVTERGICWNTTGTPTISDSHSSNGSGRGSFTHTITGVSPHTQTYYIRAYATNVYGTSYGEVIEQNKNNPYHLPVYNNYMIYPQDLGEMNWSSANSTCEGLNAYGFDDWRLPTKSEMALFVKSRNSREVFTNGITYWTSTYYGSLYDSSYMIYICESYYRYQIDYSGENVMEWRECENNLLNVRPIRIMTQ